MSGFHLELAQFALLRFKKEVFTLTPKVSEEYKEEKKKEIIQAAEYMMFLLLRNMVKIYLGLD